MNYAGKFDATFDSDGSAAKHSGAAVHFDSSPTHAPADAIIVPDAQLLFHADYSRSGVDLILSKDDHRYVVHDYFRGAKHAALASPDGAHLTPEIVKALTGEVEVSQASADPTPGQVIGHVTKLLGTATVIRNGVSVILNMGDNVEKGDVVQSGSNSTLGITFIDGTVFGLSSNARMVLNEMVYDPNGSSNSSLLSLVAGTITFVAGETAKHGDMKIDTPVATMGIRGTAVLVEIDFSVPGQNGGPSASFQVLVEPDGSTGSYILFDKTTLQPIAIVNQAGEQVNINNNGVSFTQTPLSPDLQKLITDTFQQKFSDNNSNTKSTSPSNDTIIPTSNGFIVKLADGATATVTTVTVASSSAPPAPTALSSPQVHVSGPPQVSIVDASGHPQTSFLATGEKVGLTGSIVPDSTGGRITFTDVNVGDQPATTQAFSSLIYTNAKGSFTFAAGQAAPSGLSALEAADIAATEIKLLLVPDAGNTHNGTVTWLYSLPDNAFDFLGAGETITLTYFITVNTNYAPDPESTTIPITITITGTNDVPVIITGPQTIAFAAGTKTPGGDLTSKNPTSGTLAFNDVDLTDTHTVTTQLTSAVMSHDGTIPPLPESLFEKALSASIATDSTGTGSGVVDWKFADLPVYIADFIPKGDIVTLTYAVTVTDSQGATATQTVTVTITGTNAAAEVWIHTQGDNSPDGNWTTAQNWETGNAPVATDDVIIITDQLNPNTPSYPVTIIAGTAAVAHSVTMNDFVNLPPELDVAKGGSLTIGAGGLSAAADSIVHNMGTITVGGAAEFIDQSVLQNSGTLVLQQGGDFKDQSSITNAEGGTIEVAGGTLNVDVNISNAGSIVVDDTGATLTLSGASIEGGTVTVTGAPEILHLFDEDGSGLIAVEGGANPPVTIVFPVDGVLNLQDASSLENGTLNNTGQVNASGDVSLGNESVNNLGGAITVTGTLTLDDGTVISGGTLANSAAVQVESSGGATLDGVAVDNSGGTIAVDDDSSSQTVTLTLDDGTTVTNGELTIGKVGILEVSSEGGATLDGVSVGNSNTVQVDEGSALLLDDGTTITGGDLTNAGTLQVETVDGATLDGVSVGNSGTVQVDEGSTLLLDDGTTITGGDLTNTGTLQVESADGATLDGVSVDNSGGTIAVDCDDSPKTVTLTLDGGTTITDGDVTIGKVGILEVSSEVGATLDGVSVDNSGTVQVDEGSTLLLDDGTTITGGSLTNAGTLQIESADGATLDNVSVDNSGGTIAVDCDDSPQTVTLTLDDGTTLTNGDLTVGKVGILELSSEDGATLDGVGVDNSGTVQVDEGSTLLLDDGTTVTGGELTIESSGVLEISSKDGATLDDVNVSNSGTVQVDEGSTLLLDDGTTITGGDLTNAGTLQVESADGATFDDVSVDNSGGTIAVDCDDSPQTVTLTLDDGTTITNGDLTVGKVGILEVSSEDGATLDGVSVDNSGTVQVDEGSTLLLDDGTTITGGSLTNAGTVQVESADGATLDSVSVDNSGGTIAVDCDDSPQTVTLMLDDGTTLTNGDLTIGKVGILEVSSEDGATFDGVSVDNSGTVQVDEGSTLVLDDGTAISGGSLANSGTLDVASDDGATLDGVNVDNSLVQIDEGSTLLLDDGTTISGGGLDNSGMLQVETAGGATLDGVNVDNSGGTIAVDGDTSPQPVTLTLDDGTGVTGGQLSIGSVGILEVSSDEGATLDGVGVDNSGTVQIDEGSTLLLDDGTTISGGNLDNSGTLQIETLDGATLDGVSVDNSGGTIAVDGPISPTSVTLTLDDGTTITNGDLSIGSVGILEVSSEAGATLNGVIVDNSGIIQVDSTLTLDGSTITGGKITDNGTVAVDKGKTLKLSGVSLSGGNVNNTGTIEITGSGSIDNDNLVNAAAAILLIDANQTLTLNGTTINGGAVTNNGTVNVDGEETLTLNAVAVTGGDVTNAGTINSTGGGAIDNADITNTGTIESTVGVMTIDPAGGDNPPPTVFTLTNSGTLQANGGELDIVGEQIGNSGTVQAIHSSTLKLNGMTLTDTGNGNVSVEGGSTLDLTNADISGGTLTNAGTLDNVSGSNTISAAVTNTGIIEVKAGTLDLSGGLTGAGQLVIDNGATLQLTGADAQSVTFSGGGTLELDNSLGFTGTIAATSSAGGTFTVEGAGNLTSTSGDGIDFTASGGTDDTPADVMLTPSGTITGAANGIFVVQNGVGDLTVDPSGNVTGNAGNGIAVEDSATGFGKITVDATGAAAGTGAGSVGLLVQNLNAGNGGAINVTATGGASGAAYGIEIVNDGNGDVTLEAGSTVTASGQYGIRVLDQGTGSENVTTDANSSIVSSGTGINVVNIDQAISASADSNITVTAHGTIHSGATANLDGTVAGGIYAGYRGVASPTPPVPDTSVDGTVTVNNYANITADAGYGINAYNWGNGDVTVNDEAGTTVTGAQYGISAAALSGGTGNVTVNVAANATVTGTSAHGILAENADVGNVSVTTSTGDVINSGSTGITAYDSATSLLASANSTVSVVAYGTINSGSGLNPNGTTPGGIQAGYLPGQSSAVDGNVAGNVSIQNYATINAAAGYGIDGYNFGTGNVTITAEATSSITAGGIGIGGFAEDGGNVEINNDKGAVDTGATGISAFANGAGTVSITNDGQVSGNSSAGILVTQNANGATGSTTVTNSGSVEGATTAIVVHENIGGIATIDNSGTIGPDTVTASTKAIFEDGGDVSIDNTGTINGTINVGNGTFTNEKGATWDVGGASGFGFNSTTGVSEANTIDNAGTIDLSHSASLSGVDGLIIENSGQIDTLGGSDSINGATITNTGTIDVSGGTLTLNSVTIANSVTDPVTHAADNGTVSVELGATLDLTGSISGGLVSNTGTIDSAGTSSIDAAITNNGSIEVVSGTLMLAGSLTGTGSATIDAGATLDLHLDDSQAVTFNGAGAELKLDEASSQGGSGPSVDFSFTGEISGFAATDKIDLAGIGYGSATTASYNATTGVLTVSDGQGDQVNLDIGTGYGGAHFAGGGDGSGGTLITLNANDDAPAFAQVQQPPASLAEQPDTTGSSTPDATGGTVTFTDIDLTDRPTIAITAQSVDWIDASGADLSASLTPDQINALEHALTLTPATGNTNNGSAGWTYSIADDALDFLGQGQTLTVNSTLTVDDHQGQQVTTQVTVAIAGANDAPTIAFDGASSVPTDQGSPVTVNGLSVADVDGGNGTEQLTLSVGHGTISFDGETGASLTISGTLATLDAALANGVVYTPDISYFGNDALHVQINDQAPDGSALTASTDIALSVTQDVLTDHDDAITNAAPPSSDGWVLDAENGHYYREVTTFSTFADALANASKDGGYLATITSAAEETFVVNHVIDGFGATWLAGVTHNDPPGGSLSNSSTWTWLAGPEAGTTFTYTNWNSGEPNGGFDASTQWLQIGPTGGWNDATDQGQPGDSAGAGYLEEWGGLSGQIAFNENTGTTIADSVLLANGTDSLGRAFTITSVGGESAHGGTVTLDGNSIDYTPGANYSGADSFTYTISDGVTTSTGTVSFDVASALAFNGMTLDVSQGGTTVLTNSDFSVTDPGVTNFTYSVSGVTGGQFEVFNGENWVSAPTGGFTTAQIAAGDVEFASDGGATAPTFSIQVSDGSNVAGPISPTVDFTGEPSEPFHWVHASDGDFAGASNWSSNIVPGLGDDAAIDASGASYTVTSSVNEGVNSLTLGTDATLNVTAGTFTIENGTGTGSNDGWIMASQSGEIDIFGPVDASLGAFQADGGGRIVFEGNVTDNLVEATNGGIVEFNGVTIVNSDGLIEASGMLPNNADHHSMVELINATIEGGTISGVGGGIVETVSQGDSSTTSTLDGSTDNGSVGITGDFIVGYNTTLDLLGDIYNGGAITDHNDIAITGTVNLYSGGSVSLSGGAIDGSDPVGDTLNNYNLIQGYGSVGAGHLSLDNFGTVDSTDPGNLMTVDIGLTGTFVNDGFVKSDGAGVEFVHDVTNDGVFQSNSGVIQVDGNYTGNGVVTLDGGDVAFNGSSNAVVQFTENAGGTLHLNDVAGFGGSVSGFGDGDTIDLADTSSNSVHVVDVNGVTEVLIQQGCGPSQSFVLHGDHDPTQFTISGDSSGTGTDIAWDHPAPTIVTDDFSTAKDGTDTIVSGVEVQDSDSAATSFTASVTTGDAPESSVTPSSVSGDLNGINQALSAITYDPGQNPAQTDQVNLTVSDNLGDSSSVHFIFSQGGSGASLVGTAGNDVIFAGGQSDTLTGNGGQDQFVFKVTNDPGTVQHTITDFNVNHDTIDVRAFGNIGSWTDVTETQQGSDTLLTLDNHTTVLLQNVMAANLHASDFIVNPHQL